MTALASGSSVTVSVRDGGTVAIATNGGTGSVVATLVEGGTVTASLGPAPERRVLGPYSEGAALVVSNINCNAFDYDVETRSDSGVAFQIARSAVAVSVTGTISETTLATVTIPAGAMGPNGGVLVKTRWSMPTSANNKIVKHRLGGLTGSTQGTTTYTTNTFAQLDTTIRNRNSAASQYSITAGTRSTDPVVSTSIGTPSSVDTSAPQDIAITGQLGLGSETLTLEGYEVWLLP